MNRPVELSLPSGRRRWMGTALAGLLVAAVLTVGVWRWPTDDAAAASPRDVAEETAELLVGLSADNANQTLRALEDLASGPWARQLTADPETVSASLASAEALSRGQIDAVALDDSTAGSRTYLVAASATVTNRRGAQASPRAYLLVITVRDVAASSSTTSWRVTQIEVAA